MGLRPKPIRKPVMVTFTRHADTTAACICLLDVRSILIDTEMHFYISVRPCIPGLFYDAEVTVVSDTGIVPVSAGG